MADFVIKTGDTAPFLRQTLLDFEDNPVDIQAADVIFRMRHFQGETVALTGVPSNDQNGNGLDGSLGYVSYEWGDGDLDEAGPYHGEWEVTFASGEIETFPNDSYIEILILADIQELS
jgi:hypothetical protein